MQITRKILTLNCVIVLSLLVLFPFVSCAQDDTDDTIVIPNPVHATSIEAILSNTINYIFWFATAIVPIMIIVGGFLFITAAGDVNKVEQAKRLITYTAIGYAIVLFSKGLVYVLKSILGG